MLSMRVNGLRGQGFARGEEFKYGQMAPDMKAGGLRIKLMALAG